MQKTIETDTYSIYLQQQFYLNRVLFLAKLRRIVVALLMEWE